MTGMREEAVTIPSGWYSVFIVVVMFSCLIYILAKSTGARPPRI